MQSSIVTSIQTSSQTKYYMYKACLNVFNVTKIQHHKVNYSKLNSITEVRVKLLGCITMKSCKRTLHANNE